MVDLVHLLVYLLVLVLIFGVVWYAINQIPLPPPMRVIVIVVLCIILILVLLGLIGFLPGSTRVGWLGGVAHAPAFDEIG